MKYLFILNDPPYGSERAYNGLRLANNILKKAENAEVTIFLMGNGVSCAKAGQKTPNGYYNLEKMFTFFIQDRGRLLLCGSCMDSRGIKEEELIAGARRSSLDELTEHTITADTVLVF